MENSDAYQKVQEIIADISYAMLTTIDANGDFHSRPMVIQKGEFKGELTFITGDNSAKVQEIEEHSRVAITLSEPKKQSYVAITGTATVDRDRTRIKEIWNPAYRAFFPEGPEDPNICLLRVKVSSAEYWASPSSAVVYLYGLAKAMVTGEPAHPGEHKKVELAP